MLAELFVISDALTLDIDGAVVSGVSSVVKLYSTLCAEFPDESVLLTT